MLSPFLSHQIIALYRIGKNASEISEIVSVSRSTVRYIISKYVKTSQVQMLGGCGRKKALTMDDEAFICNMIDANPKLTAVEITKELAQKGMSCVSPRTVRNFLRFAGFLCSTACRKPYISPKNKKKRVELCTKWSYLPKKAWSTVIYSDECKFEVWNTSRSKKVWRRANSRYEEKNLQPTVKYGGSVMVWGCMGANGVGKLVFIDGIMDRFSYVRILSENLAISAEKLEMDWFTFQQDNDPKHTSKHARDYFNTNDIQVMLWPAQSPDLNPIENLWSYMKAVVARHTPKNVRELKELLIRCWNEIPSEYTAKLVDSMPRRIEAVLRVNGGHTKY